MGDYFYSPFGERRWKALDALLHKLDQEMAAFAQARNLEFTANYHNSPNRNLFWEEQGIARKFEIQALESEHPTFVVAVFAWRDRREGRFWKSKTLADGIAFETLRKNMKELLGNGYKLANSWSAEKLVEISKWPAGMEDWASQFDSSEK